MLIPDTPEDLDSLDATIAHLQALGKPFLVDPIIEPIGSGFAASLGRYLEVRRRHPEVEMLMGIGNLTELTEADSTGVTALLIGFCQELGIRHVLTTSVIEWARGAVREAAIAAQLMHFAVEQGTPPKHVDGRLVTVRDDELRPYAESELRELHEQVTDPNFRIFADADWIYVFNAERFVKGTDLNRDLRRARGRRGDARVLPGQGADEGDDRARAAQELPAGVSAGLGVHDVRRAEARAREADGRAREGRAVKKILIQLDTDEHPSTFDAIVAHDADVDVLLSHGNVDPKAAKGLVQSAVFTRGPKELSNTAVWVGGSRVSDGEKVFEEVQKAFFGPFQVSVMIDSNGCNTTAATAVALLAKRLDLEGRKVAIVGAGAVGLRAATLLRDEGCEVLIVGIPSSRFGGGEYRRARGLTTAEELDLPIAEPEDDEALAKAVDGASLVLAAGPAGIEALPKSIWAKLDAAEVLVDFNAAEPLGIEGSEAQDDFEEREGKKVLGALAVGGPKMKVHKACIRKLFESNDLILDAEGVYAVAKELG